MPPAATQLSKWARTGKCVSNGIPTLASLRSEVIVSQSANTLGTMLVKGRQKKVKREKPDALPDHQLLPRFLDPSIPLRKKVDPLFLIFRSGSISKLCIGMYEGSDPYRLILVFDFQKYRIYNLQMIILNEYMY